MQIELAKAKYRTLPGVREIADRDLFTHGSGEPSDRKEYFSTLEHDGNSPAWPLDDEFEDRAFWEELVGRLRLVEPNGQ